MSVIRDTKAFDKGLISFSLSYQKSRELCHDYAVSSMFHTAAHRQLDPKTRSDKLHRFYDVLKKNDQDAFRQWVSALVTWKVEKNGKIETHRWLSGSTNDQGMFTWSIVKGTEVQSKQFADDIDNIDNMPSFFDHEPSSRPPGFFGEQELLKSIENLLKRASKDENRKNISDNVFNIVEIAKLQLEKTLEPTGKPLGASQAQPAEIVPASELSKGQKAASKAAKVGGKVLETMEEAA